MAAEYDPRAAAVIERGQGAVAAGLQAARAALEAGEVDNVEVAAAVARVAFAEAELLAGAASCDTVNLMVHLFLALVSVLQDRWKGMIVS